jgi:hypothetical protein
MSQQPHWQQQPYNPYMQPPMPPQPPKRKVRKAIGMGCGMPMLLAFAIGVTAAVSNDYDTSTTTPATPSSTRPAATKDTPPPAIDRRTLTRLSIGVVWDDMTEAKKDSMCLGVEAFGTDWAAEQMRRGAHDNDNASTMDWEYAAEIVANKCDARG